MIRSMKNERIIHDQAQRLYLAAKELKQREGKAEVARLLNVSDQNINGWEKRGISEGGLLAAQEIIGCDAIWLRDGTGSMVHGGETTRSNLSDVARLVAAYGRASDIGRTQILRMAEALAEDNGSGTFTMPNDKLKSR